MDDSNNKRPRVTLQIPPPSQMYRREESFQQQSPYVQPMTAASSIPAHVNPFMHALYNQKASDFMFKQFEGLNRFTKSGLSVGEKSVVWLYTKFRAWSTKW